MPGLWLESNLSCICTGKLVTEENRKLTKDADAIILLQPVHVVITVARKYRVFHNVLRYNKYL
jgi:ASC-1-like (ASCH) protein